MSQSPSRTFMFAVCVPIFGYGGCGAHVVRSVDTNANGGAGQCFCGGYFLPDEPMESRG